MIVMPLRHVIHCLLVPQIRCLMCASRKKCCASVNHRSIAFDNQKSLLTASFIQLKLNFAFDGNDAQIAQRSFVHLIFSFVCTQFSM